MKYLIVNADDFGYTYGINKGIIEAHTQGILTSTSLMVDEIAAQEATALNKFKGLSVGLHFVAGGKEDAEIESELDRQLALFTKIMGRKPDHIDTHKVRPSAHPFIKQLLEEYSDQHKVPIRSLGHARLIESFFGLNIDGSGTYDKDKISVEGFKRAADEVDEGYNELMCHVGYSGAELRSRSSYSDAREIELATLTSKEVKDYIVAKGISLCSWRELKF